MSCSCKIGGGPNGVCFECRSRRHFHERLKKLEEARSVDYGRGLIEGRRLERAAIVADLRARADAEDMSATTERTLRVLADLYERGEHEEAT